MMVTAEPAEWARVAIRQFAPPIRNHFLNDREFCAKYSLSVASWITFGESGLTVREDEFLAAVAAAFNNPQSPQSVSGRQGDRWVLTIRPNGNDVDVVLSQDERRISLEGYGIYSPNPDVRLRSFLEDADEALLPSDAIAAWRQKFEERAPSAREFEAYRADIRDTPTSVDHVVRDAVRSGGARISTFIPHSRRYYERLIGPVQTGGSLSAYAGGPGALHVRQLIDQSPSRGLRLALLTASHSKMLANIDIRNLPPAEVLSALEWIRDHGDILSQCAALELGARTPQLFGGVINALADKVTATATEGSRFGLLSNLFVFVDGELARTRLFADAAPYWRRMAAFAHASLLERALIGEGVDTEQFGAWAIGARGQHFYLQSFVDLRTEPRWLPDFAASEQLEQEFLGRVVHMARANETELREAALETTFLEGDNSIAARLRFPAAFLAGPLEGAVGEQNPLPDNLATDIASKLAAESLDPSAVTMLVNLALLFRIEATHAEVVATAFKNAKHKLSSAKSEDEASYTLTGLAFVAATTRSETLAGELRIMTRRARNTPATSLSAEGAFRIGMIAAGAYGSSQGWIEFLGEWISEIAFGDLTGNEAATIRSHLLVLCDLVPDLWSTLGRAEAALQTVEEV